MDRRLRILFPTLLLILAFFIYWLTKPPSILWIDSGTMIAASSSLGIPNPPGFPFYMMAAHLFTLLPMTKLASLELFTIVFSLALLFVVYRIILLLINSDFFFDKFSVVEDSINSSNTQTTTNYLPYLSALFGAISLAFSYQYWSQSQNTEGFIFTYFFVALFAYLLLRIQLKKRQLLEKTIPVSTFSRLLFKFLLLIAFLYGLAAGANPTVASMVPGVIFVMYLNRKYLDLKKLAILGTVFILTLAAVYSYLPIRASHYPFVNWGNPQTLELFIGHLHGAGLNIYEPEGGSINGFTGSPLVFIQSVSYFLLNSLLQFTPFLIPFIIMGIFLVYKKNKKLLMLLTCVPLFDVVYSGIYYSGNQESWFILSWIFFAIFIGLGFYFFVTHFSITGTKLIFAFLLCLLPLLMYFTTLNRSSHFFASDYAYNLYGPLEKNAILLGTGDFFNSLSHYLHEADVFRSDITPITSNVFYVNRWYRDDLRHATNLSISENIEKIIQYKSFSEYNEAMNELIAENIDKHPIYVTHLALRASALAATTGGQLKLDSRFKFIPSGLSLRVVRASDEAKPNLSLYNFNFKSSLAEAPKYLEKNYRAGFKNLINDYVFAYEFLADWFAENKQDDLAIKFYQQALDLSKTENAELLAHLGEFYAIRNQLNPAYQYLEQAQRLDVKNVSIHFNLGLTYTNLGRTADAKQEFESVKQLAPIGDPIGLEADNIIKQITTLNLSNPDLAAQTKDWQTIKDTKNNFSIKIPPDFQKQDLQPLGSIFITNNKLNNLGLNVEIFGSKFSPNDNVEELIKNSPLKMTGLFLDVQPVNFYGYTAAVQIFGTPAGDSSQRFILLKNNWLWQFKVYPANSIKLSDFYKMISTFKPIE